MVDIKWFTQIDKIAPNLYRRLILKNFFCGRPIGRAEHIYICYMLMCGCKQMTNDIIDTCK